MTQKEFLLNWLQQHAGEKFSPETLREVVDQAYRDSAGRTFGDVGKAARELQKTGRIQRSSKGLGQKYWYDPRLDTHAPLNSATKVASREEIQWQQFLLKRDGIAMPDWKMIGQCIDSGLSGQQLRKFKLSLSSLLAKHGVEPPESL